MAQRNKRGGKQKGAGGDLTLGQRVLGRMPLVSGWSREWLADDARSVQPRHFRLLALSPALSLPRVAQGNHADLETLLEPRDTPMALNARFAAAGLGNSEGAPGASSFAPEPYYAPTLGAPQSMPLDSSGWQDVPLQELVTDEATAALEIPYELLAQYQEGWDAGAPDLRASGDVAAFSDESGTGAPQRALPQTSTSARAQSSANVSTPQPQQGPRARATTRPAQATERPLRSIPQAAIQSASLPLASSPSEQYSHLLAERMRRAQSPIPGQPQPRGGAPQQTAQTQSGVQNTSVNPASGPQSTPQPHSAMPTTQGQPAPKQRAESQPARPAQPTQWNSQQSMASAITERIREAALARERGAEAPVYNAAAAASTASELDQRLAQGMRRQLAEREGIDPNTLPETPVVRKPSAEESARRAERWRAFSRVEVLSTATPAPTEEGVLPKAAPLRPEERAAIQGVSSKPLTSVADESDTTVIDLGAVEVIEEETADSPSARTEDVAAEVAAAGEFNEDGDLIDAEYEVRGVSDYAAPTYEPTAGFEPVAQVAASGEGEFEDFESMLAELEEDGEGATESTALIDAASPASAPATAQDELPGRSSVGAERAARGTQSETVTEQTTGTRSERVSAADATSPAPAAQAPDATRSVPAAQAPDATRSAPAAQAPDVVSSAPAVQATDAESTKSRSPVAEQPAAKSPAKGRGKGSRSKARASEVPAEAAIASITGENTSGADPGAAPVDAANAQSAHPPVVENVARPVAGERVEALSAPEQSNAQSALPAQEAVVDQVAAPPPALSTSDISHADLNALPSLLAPPMPAAAHAAATTQDALPAEPSVAIQSPVSVQPPTTAQPLAAANPTAARQTSVTATTTTNATAQGATSTPAASGVVQRFESVENEVASDQENTEATAQAPDFEAVAQSVESEPASAILTPQPLAESEMTAASSAQPEPVAQGAPQPAAPEGYETNTQPTRAVRVKPVQRGVQSQALPEPTAATASAVPTASTATPGTDGAASVQSPRFEESSPAPVAERAAAAESQAVTPPADASDGGAVSTESTSERLAPTQARTESPEANRAAQPDAPTLAQRPPPTQPTLQDELPLVRPNPASVKSSITGQEPSPASGADPAQDDAPFSALGTAEQYADAQGATFEQTEPQTPLEAWVRRSLDALFAEGATVAPPTDEFGKQALAYNDSLRTEAMAQRALESSPVRPQGSEPDAPSSNPGGTSESAPAAFNDVPTPEGGNWTERPTPSNSGGEPPAAGASDAPSAFRTSPSAPKSAAVRVAPVATPRMSAASVPTLAAGAPAGVIQRTPADDALDEWVDDQSDHSAPQVGHIENAPYTNGANDTHGANGASQSTRTPASPRDDIASPAHYAGAPQSDILDNLPLVKHRRTGSPRPAAPDHGAERSSSRVSESYTGTTTERATEPSQNGGQTRQTKSETTTRKVPDSVVRQAYGIAPPTITPPTVSQAPSNVVQATSVEVIQRDAANDNFSNDGPSNESDDTVNLAEIARMVYPMLRDMLRIERDRFGR